MATPYNIHLAAYDGPLDLLLDLIRKQEMDIHNIPIARSPGSISNICTSSNSSTSMFRRISFTWRRR